MFQVTLSSRMDPLVVPLTIAKFFKGILTTITIETFSFHRKLACYHKQIFSVLSTDFAYSKYMYCGLEQWIKNIPLNVDITPIYFSHMEKILLRQHGNFQYKLKVSTISMHYKNV